MHDNLYFFCTKSIQFLCSYPVFLLQLDNPLRISSVIHELFNISFVIVVYIKYKYKTHINIISIVIHQF